MSEKPVVSEELIAAGLQKIFGLTEDEGGDFILREPIQLNDGKSIHGVTKAEISEIVTRLNEAKLGNESSFQWASEAEFSLISLGSIGAFDRFFEDKEFIGQGENPVTFKIGKPSREFSAYLLCLFAQNPLLTRTPRYRMLLNRVRHFDTDRTSRGYGNARRPFEADSLFEALGESLRVTTLRITSNKSRSDFELLANSFLFHAAYNIDAAARIGLDSMFRAQAIQRVRRTQTGFLDAPRQTYDADLVHHYLMGVAAEIPLLEYLAYYHIAEHFFDKIFNEDLVNQIRSGITDPSFSARRNKDIQSIIRIVTKAQRQVRDEGGVNEQRALQLVLDRFVNVSRLAADLDAYDATLVDYYANNDVPFAGASKAAIRGRDEEAARGAIAKRIYKVRNALVHAKEGELPKYAPFAHDEELAREIPLMRFTAEQIIIAQGKVL
ncbi:hypothetical protein OHS33_24900 [Streptomyces sp. NBC_00536]|uniref:hypothetical protein n=1 Tax=Streptomyces sp. NBC_00536 TaxID=2975769 RepID=UPI002E80B50B|nr:hypothetical protein [Streptomyces sp. NBC_00536]WUC81288.1 hypothetical protein OHS33_24900 [Streptomyces sp. NBC_00536]